MQTPPSSPFSHYPHSPFPSHTHIQIKHQHQQEESPFPHSKPRGLATLIQMIVRTPQDSFKLLQGLCFYLTYLYKLMYKCMVVDGERWV